MTEIAQDVPTLTGSKLVQVFLEELSTVVRRNPDHEIAGIPREIVEEVIMRTDKFANCSDKCIEYLSKQVAMAVNSKGRPYHLRYERLKAGRIKVSFA